MRMKSRKRKENDMLSAILIVAYLVIGLAFASAMIRPEELFDLKYPIFEFFVTLIFWLPYALVLGVKRLYEKIREFLIYKGII